MVSNGLLETENSGKEDLVNDFGREHSWCD